MKRIIILACLLLIAACGTTQAHTTQGKPSATQAPTATATIAPMTTIATFTGNNNKNTPNFHVDASEWVLSWSCTGPDSGAYFSVNVLHADGTVQDAVLGNVNCVGTMHDSTIERGAGDFYLTVIAGSQWSIIITA